MGNGRSKYPIQEKGEAKDEALKNLVEDTEEKTSQLSDEKDSNSDDKNVQFFQSSASADDKELEVQTKDMHKPPLQEQGQQDGRTESTCEVEKPESDPQVKDIQSNKVKPNSHQHKCSSKRFIFAISIGALILFLLLALLALLVCIFKIPHPKDTSTQEVYKKENISLVKLVEVDPFKVNEWSVSIDETAADYSVDLYSVKCSEITTESREIKRRVLDKYYPAPILPNNGIIIGTFLYLLPGSHLNYTFSIKTNSNEDEGVIGTLLEYADLDYHQNNVKPEKETMVYANTTLSVSIKEARYLLTVLEVATQGNFTLSYEWNAFQLYWNETRYDPPYCTLESPDTATCTKTLPNMGEKQCVLAFMSTGSDSPLELSIFILFSNIVVIIILSIISSCIALAIPVVLCIVCCCYQLYLRMHHS